MDQLYNYWIIIGLLGFVLLIVWLDRIRIRKRLEESNRQITNYEEQLNQMNETFRVVRSERHDFLKHISAMHFMLEHNQTNEAKNYLNQLVDSYEETNLSIKGESGVVAGILHQSYVRGKKNGIDVIYDLDLPLSSLPLTHQKIVELVGNLLSNSLDACEEWQKRREKASSVTLEFYKRSGLFILLCKNNSLPIPAPILDELFHTEGHTTKDSSHQGLGTKIIKDIVDDYHGFLDFVHKNEEFEVKIKIPAFK